MKITIGLPILGQIITGKTDLTNTELAEIENYLRKLSYQEQIQKIQTRIAIKLYDNCDELELQTIPCLSLITSIAQDIVSKNCNISTITFSNLSFIATLVLIDELRTKLNKSLKLIFNHENYSTLQLQLLYKECSKVEHITTNLVSFDDENEAKETYSQSIIPFTQLFKAKERVAVKHFRSPTPILNADPDSDTVTINSDSTASSPNSMLSNKRTRLSPLEASLDSESDELTNSSGTTASSPNSINLTATKNDHTLVQPIFPASPRL